MGLRHTYWGSTQVETRQPVVINPAQVRFLRGTPDEQTEVWFSRELVITIDADLAAAERMFEPDDEP